MKIDRILFTGIISIGAILITMGLLISPHKFLTFISKYYTHSDISKELIETHIQKVRLIKIDIVVVGCIVSAIAFKLSYLKEKLASLTEYIKLQNSRLAKIMATLVCIYFLLSGLVTFTPELLSMQYNILYKSGLSDDEKMAMVDGEFYVFISECRNLIPEEAHVLLLDNTKHVHGPISYYLYPRKIYFNPSEHLSISKIDPGWLKKQNISWYINYTPYPDFDLKSVEISKVE
jgi:hypothetical protein